MYRDVRICHQTGTMENMGLQESLTIRDLQDADHPAIRQMAARLTRGVAPWRRAAAVTDAVEGWVDDALHTADPRSNPVLVAVLDGAVIGFVSGGSRQHWTGDTDAYIGELVVEEDYVRCGVGRALVSALERWATDQGFRRITLETGTRNESALDFYRCIGFEPEEVVLTHNLA